MEAVNQARRRAIGRILFHVWDPRGVNGHAREDEYEPYVAGVEALLLSGKGDNPLFQYLAWVETDRMALPKPDPAKLALVVKALREIA